LPTQLWFLVIGIAISAIVLARTTLGRALYAIGNNVVGARFSGLRVSRALVIIYSFSGFMAALAAVVFVSRVTTTRSDMGTGLELDAIAAVVLGGTSIMGGKGTILGTVIGLVFIQLLKYGLQLAGVTGDATIIVIGSVLIVTVLLNNLIQRRRGVR
jgi:rhamnose transport system permease protein